MYNAPVKFYLISYDKSIKLLPLDPFGFVNEQ